MKYSIMQVDWDDEVLVQIKISHNFSVIKMCDINNIGRSILKDIHLRIFLKYYLFHFESHFTFSCSL